MMPADSSLTNMIFMRTIKVTVTLLLDENIDINVNMNQTHIGLKCIRVVTPQPNQNTANHYQRGKRKKQHV